MGTVVADAVSDELVTGPSCFDNFTPADAQRQPSRRLSLVLQASAILAGMLKFIRYAIATVCFVVSVGCLVLWWRSMASIDQLLAPEQSLGRGNYVECCMGYVSIGLFEEPIGGPWEHVANAISESDRKSRAAFAKRNGQFQLSEQFEVIDFPLWYPALIFALTGVASLRLGRRFTLRSTIIATIVVAGLLGMAVVM